jgi:hypothetical protein
MFRGRRGFRLIGPRRLLPTALSIQTWRSLLVSRGRGALLLPPWHGGSLRRGHGTLLLPWRGGSLRWGHGVLLLPRHGGSLRRGRGARLLPWHGGLLLSRRHGTLALARNGALR